VLGLRLDYCRSHFALVLGEAVAKTSAGLMMFRRGSVLEIFLVHPGGPFFRKKDAGAWTVPKGELEPDEDALAAARREFGEETAVVVPDGGYIELGETRQAGGKRVLAWAFEGDCDPTSITSNTFTMEWPPRSGNEQEFPEVDRAAFFTTDVARIKLNPAQAVFIDRLVEALRQ
jgi:predicted NUDIX family NTP pyrophosphohydrolase